MSWPREADLAVNGRLDLGSDFNSGNVTHTETEQQPFIEVDLGTETSIEYVRIHNRTDCCRDRLTPFVLLASTQPMGRYLVEAQAVAVASVHHAGMCLFLLHRCVLVGAV